MAIPEIFIQITDVPLGLWGQRGGAGHWSPDHHQALGWGQASAPQGKQQEAHRTHPTPTEAPTSALQCCKEWPGGGGGGRAKRQEQRGEKKNRKSQAQR